MTDDLRSVTHSSVALVTGASAGFGAAISRRFAQDGARVVALARREERLRSLVEEFGPGRVFPVAVDVRDTTAVTEALAALPDPFASIDCLVNNAGLALGLAFAPAAVLDDWHEMIDTNCKALVTITRAVLPGMVERGRGHIVNLGSVAGAYPYPGANVYGATKAFVHQFSLNLRSDLHGTGLRVTCIEPGLCGGTEFSQVRFGGDHQKAAAVYAGVEPITPEDIAATVAWVNAQPPHVNINVIEMMPVAQSFAPLQVYRT